MSSPLNTRSPHFHLPTVEPHHQTNTSHPHDATENVHPLVESPRPSYISLSSSPAMRRQSMYEFIVDDPVGTAGLSPDLISFAMAPPSKLPRLDSISRLTTLLEMRSQRLIGSSKALTNWEKLRVDVAAIKGRKLKKFYARQNSLIDRYIEIDRLLDSKIPTNLIQVYGDNNIQRRRQEVPANVDEESMPLLGGEGGADHEAGVRFAILINFALNVVLLAGKGVIAALSNSLSLVASLVDSALDFLSTAIIWTSTRVVQSADFRLQSAFPVGRSRLEPIGVLVFSIIMIVSFMQVFIEAIARLYHGDEDVALGLYSVIVMVLTILSKFAAWLWCRSVNSSSVQALAQDAITDVIFNTFSILFPVLAYMFRAAWLDSFGAMALSLYVIISWTMTSLEHIQHLTGAACDVDDRQVILYLCMRFADSIQQVNSLNAYYAGDRLSVEVDVLVSEKMTVRDSHDIGESLQYAIETLPFVERAFVHIDYRADNFTGHIPH
ncbi:cation efflux family-domain-containing protein [Limtongia smithiae]|uniref:cation efflux family-domain-containing protein n=1 Tax=Limtongia smithiae TaxID=1125753 RepID=UPI0034CF427A